nr:protein N-lysine methyltransferase METTL21A isoform X1 [Ipomoea batatas]
MKGKRVIELGAGCGVAGFGMALLGCDVVYAEHLLEPLLQTILALSGPKTTILLGYEIRSTNVHEKMLELWKRNFEVKTVPKAKVTGKLFLNFFCVTQKMTLFRQALMILTIFSILLVNC